METCECCGKTLRAPNFIDTCMCRGSKCPDCGYCEMHSKYLIPHDQVHANRIEAKNNVDDTDTAANSQPASEVG